MLVACAAAGCLLCALVFSVVYIYTSFGPCDVSRSVVKGVQ